MSQGKLIYLRGDATEPQYTGGLRIIVHCCNDVGVWGAGFVMSLSKKWKAPEEDFRKNYATFQPSLGHVSLVPVERDIVVCNLIGQRGVGSSAKGTPPIRYKAIEDGLHALATFANTMYTMGVQQWFQPDKVPSSIHMPRMGAGLAGGDWSQIEGLVLQCLVNRGFDVYVYDYVPKGAQLLIVDDPHQVDDFDEEYMGKVKDWFFQTRKRREMDGI